MFGAKKYILLGIVSVSVLACTGVGNDISKQPFLERVNGLKLIVSQPKTNRVNGMLFNVKLLNPSQVELCVTHTPGVILSNPSSEMVLEGKFPSHGEIPSGVVEAPLKLRPIEVSEDTEYEVDITVTYPYGAYFSKSSVFHSRYEPGVKLVAQAYLEVFDCNYEDRGAAISAGASFGLSSGLSTPFVAEADMFKRN